MTGHPDTLFERFFAPILENVLLDQAALSAWRDRLDWTEAVPRLSNPQVIYPNYYRDQRFHGLEGGYLSIEAAITYDAVTQYALPPHETWVRQSALDAVQGRPRRIVELGCGTGTMALMLQRAFPAAEVLGIDLSPYMLVVAEDKARQADLPIRWHQGRAEQTGLAAERYDLVIISLLLHETPPTISQAILQEALRLLRSGGEVVILDGNQKVLRQTDWLMQIFEEPYIHDYAEGNLDAWMGAAGFGWVRSHDVWLVHQVTHGVKGVSDHRGEELFADLECRDEGVWATG
jgi:ubiquinone/menaquinone biosynthesis C-methylase UbiE